MMTHLRKMLSQHLSQMPTQNHSVS
jgi:hypothetical protein